MKRFFPSLKSSQNEDTEGASTSSNIASTSAILDKDNDNGEPSTKKFKTDNDALTANLSQFLNCVVCLDLPSAAIYQCRNGHIMCECCFVRLLAERTIRKQQARCPLCRVFIPKKKPIRCLCAERAATLLPVQCTYCSEILLKAHLAEHQSSLCPTRPTQCKYKLIGCTWTGSYAELQEHEQHCKQSKQPLNSLLPAIQMQEFITQTCSTAFERFLESLNDGRFFIQDLCTAHHDYNNFTHTIYYTTDKFRAWDLHWAIKFKFVHPEYLTDDNIDGGFYQLLFKSRPDRHINAKFFLLQNSNTGVHLPFKLHEHEFSSYNLESDFKAISLPNTTDIYRVLAKLHLQFRFVMVIAP